MWSLPELPDYNALHVIVIHFPIALLALAAPALMLVALLIPKHARQLAAAAGLMLALGTATCFVATSTGSAAAELAKSQGVLEDSEISASLEKHAEMGEAARNYFAILTAAYLLYLLMIGVRREELHPMLNALILLVFFCANGVLALGLANAAHEGGELVHTHGILAPLEPGAGKAAAAAAVGMGAAGDDSDYEGSETAAASGNESAEEPESGESSDH